MLEQARLESLPSAQPQLVGERHLKFSGAKNFRDLGGYQTADGRTVRWNLLYRSDALHKLTAADLHRLAALQLDRVMDFRATHEQEHEPDRLPEGVSVVPIPILDSSTKVWHEAREEFVKNLRSMDPIQFMLQTNVELGTRFTPQFKLFLHELLSASGRPVLFHCAAGKDRTGFAAAILLRILGVPPAIVMQDYLLTNQYFMNGYRWNLWMARLLKGKKFADVLKGFMIADSAYLSAAFDALQREHGSFESYVRDGLGLAETETEHLKHIYLA